jgi:hypothetical protein
MFDYLEYITGVKEHIIVRPVLLQILNTSTERKRAAENITAQNERYLPHI